MRQIAVFILTALSCTALLLASLPVYAQDAPATEPQKSATPTAQAAAPAPDRANAETANLQKAVQNPVASLISVPIQNNSNFNVGSYNRTQDVMNLQPVIPLSLGKNWNLITRIIQPIIWQPYSDQNTGGEYGLGDMNPTFFLSPAKPGKLIWGVGPAFILPTATDDTLGQGKFSLGPGVLLLTQPGPWTLGFLTNNVWSVAGSGSRPPVNQFLLQYFVNHNLKKGWYIAVSPIITANWRASSGNVWTVPFGGGIGRVMKLGFQPINLKAQFFYNVVNPEGSSNWSMQLQISFLFPKMTPQQKKMMMEQQLKQLEQQEQQQKPPQKQ